MVASGFFNEVPARDAVASLSHRRAANKCGAAILPFDSGTAPGWKKTIVWLRTADGEKFLCRAICPELSEQTISLKEITAARNARRRELRGQITTRVGIVDKLLAAHHEPLPAPYPVPVRPATYTDAARPGPRPAPTASPDEPGHTRTLRLYWNE